MAGVLVSNRCFRRFDGFYQVTGSLSAVPHIEKFHAAEIKVIPVVPSVKLAKRVEEAGVDAMVIEGMEGGGHIGQQTTMALMTNVLPLTFSGCC